MDSILLTIKKGLMLEEAFDGFDQQLKIILDNSFFTLLQLGVLSSVFSLEDEDSLWSEVPVVESELLGPLKAYVLIDVRLVFDPPTTAHLLSALERQKEELVNRLRMIDFF